MFSALYGINYYYRSIACIYDNLACAGNVSDVAVQRDPGEKIYNYSVRDSPINEVLK